MMHTSIKMDRPIEIINVVPLNPLISKCQIKVCWVGPEPNRNKSIITKEVAREMANSLPGSPIVGYYLEDKGDFEEHSRQIKIVDGKIKLKDITQPYGFVDLNAKCWFEWFMDDGEVAREYLVTEGYLWTGQYPEVKRVTEIGNNHSMELDEEKTKAHWTKDKNGKPQFFIINEAIISKLCILGVDKEPCFEGSQITAPTVQFSLEDDFKTELFSMMNDLKQILSEGGTKMEDNKITVTSEEEIAPVVEEEVVDYEKKSDKKDEEEVKKTEEPTTEEKKLAEDEEEKKKKANYVEDKEEICPECGKLVKECVCHEDKKEKYCLDEVVEYTDLLAKYSALETQYNNLVQEKAELEAQIVPLTEFKNAAELKEKENMIASFYMLSDEDKKEVVDNINQYSVDEIEAKLSVICVRNKVSFALDAEEGKDNGPTIFNLNGVEDEAAGLPGWIKAAEAIAASKNK